MKMMGSFIDVARGDSVEGAGIIYLNLSSMFRILTKLCEHSIINP